MWNDQICYRHGDGMGSPWKPERRPFVRLGCKSKTWTTGLPYSTAGTVGVSEGLLATEASQRDRAPILSKRGSRHIRHIEDV